MMNKGILIGNVGHTPDIRSGKSGEVASLSLATSKSWKDQATGERKTVTQWHKVVIFNTNLINVVKNYVKKGSKIYVEGEIETRKYMGKDNIERYTTEIVLRQFNGSIVLLDKREGSAPPPADDADSYGSHSDTPPPNHAMEDDIPF